MKKEKKLPPIQIDSQQFNFQAYGVKVGIKAQENEYLLEIEKRLGRILPNGFEKIESEDLLEKLDKFKENSKNQTKNLEQLVELTKKYYVEKNINHRSFNHLFPNRNFRTKCERRGAD